MDKLPTFNPHLYSTKAIERLKQYF
uniref:Uncharacterized protein n=1 Tax=Tetranychus urticae TaxID=32264 RepID=T1KQD8_TETUR